MSKPNHDPIVKILRECLTQFPLRYIEERAGIGKNRLHTLRHFPLGIKLHELLALRNTRFLSIDITKAKSGQARRRK